MIDAKVDHTVMNRKTFWGAFALAQIVGSLGVATGSPHGNPSALLLALIFLFPGSLLCWPVLDGLRIQTTVGPVIIASVLFNVVCWTIAGLSITRIRKAKSS
jgi:hypothetical protein